MESNNGHEHINKHTPNYKKIIMTSLVKQKKKPPLLEASLKLKLSWLVTT